jgi:hypothetical protein
LIYGIETTDEQEKTRKPPHTQLKALHAQERREAADKKGAGELQ